MSLEIEDVGRNNTIKVTDQVLSTGSGRVTIKGDGNIIEIGDGTVLGDCNITLGDECHLEIGGRCFFHSFLFYGAEKARCFVGDGVSLNSRVRFLAHEPGQIQIGEGALFASDIDLTISDMHSIFDLESGLRINPAKDVWIGPNVWIGERCMILKGAKIGQGSVIGANSVVSGEIEAHSLAAGAPARILRRGIAWDRRIMDRIER